MNTFIFLGAFSATGKYYYDNHDEYWSQMQIFAQDRKLARSAEDLVETLEEERKWKEGWNDSHDETMEVNSWSISHNSTHYRIWYYNKGSNSPAETIINKDNIDRPTEINGTSNTWEDQLIVDTIWLLIQKFIPPILDDSLQFLPAVLVNIISDYAIDDQRPAIWTDGESISVEKSYDFNFSEEDMPSVYIGKFMFCKNIYDENLHEKVSTILYHPSLQYYRIVDSRNSICRIPTDKINTYGYWLYNPVTEYSMTIYIIQDHQLREYILPRSLKLFPKKITNIISDYLFDTSVQRYIDDSYPYRDICAIMKRMDEKD